MCPLGSPGWAALHQRVHSLSEAFVQSGKSQWRLPAEDLFCQDCAKKWHHHLHSPDSGKLLGKSNQWSGWRSEAERYEDLSCSPGDVYSALRLLFHLLSLLTYLFSPKALSEIQWWTVGQKTETVSKFEGCVLPGLHLQGVYVTAPRQVLSKFNDSFKCGQQIHPSFTWFQGLV